MKGWQADPKELQNILKYHIVTNERKRTAYYRSDEVLKTLYENETIMVQEIESVSYIITIYLLFNSVSRIFLTC